MPLCGIISSECLGTLPGAWAKPCGNVLEVNAWEWLWDTAWAASARGPAADRKWTAFRSPCLVKTVLRVPSHLSWLTPSFSFLGFCWLWVTAPRPHHQKQKQNHRQGHTGGTQQAPRWVFHVVMFCPPLGLGDENISAKQTRNYVL